MDEVAGISSGLPPRSPRGIFAIHRTAATGKWSRCVHSAENHGGPERAGIHTSSSDRADAYWLWAMGMAAYGSPVVELPKTHTAALGAVTWPGLD